MIGVRLSGAIQLDKLMINLSLLYRLFQVSMQKEVGVCLSVQRWCGVLNR